MPCVFHRVLYYLLGTVSLMVQIYHGVNLMGGWIIDDCDMLMPSLSLLREAVCINIFQFIMYV